MRQITFLLLVAAVLAAGGCSGSRKATIPLETMASPEVAEAEAEVDAASSGQQMPGGYTAPRALTDEDRALFEVATKELVGVRYVPESVATQVVAGINYRFVCTATPSTRNPETYRVEVIVFKPLPGRGDPTITAANRL